MKPSFQFFRRKTRSNKPGENGEKKLRISDGLQAGSVSPLWHCTLLWFGCGEGAGNFFKKVQVEEFLWIELPIGRDTFCVGCLFTSLPFKRCVVGECGVDFGVSSKFQGGDSNLLLLKLVTLPSSSLQNCQNPDLLPLFFACISAATAVSKFFNLKNVKKKKRSKIWVTSKIRMSRSLWRCCDKICWKPSCRLVMDDSSVCWRLGITCLDTWMWGSHASCLNKMLIYETCGCVSIISLSVPELCWVLP